MSQICAFIAGAVLSPYLLLVFISFTSDAQFCRSQFTRWQMIKRALVWPIELVMDAWNE